MTYIAEIQLNIKAVEVALASFTKYRNKEEERVAFLDSQLETVQFLDVYADFPKDELWDTLNKLQDALNKLQAMENLLLAQQQCRIYLFVSVQLSNLLVLCRFCSWSWCSCN